MSNVLTWAYFESQKKERANERKIFEEILAENLTYLLKDIDLQIQGAHHTTIRMNTRDATL